MRPCSNDDCRHPLADDAKFCPECGQRQPARVWDVSTMPVSLTKPAAPPSPPPHQPAAAETPQPGPSPDRTDHADPGDRPDRQDRPDRDGRRRGRVLLVGVAIVAVLAGIGFGGRAVWAATAVRRTCALQPDQVATATRWQPTSTTVEYGTDPYPSTRCSYVDRSTGSGGIRNIVTITTAATEAGTTPGQPQRCLNGGYWHGHGYVCQNQVGASILDDGWRSIGMTGVRLNGDATYAVDVVCIEPPDAAADPTTVSQETQRQCLTTLTSLMAATAAKLDIRADASVPQQPISVDGLAAAAASAEGTTPSAGDGSAGTAGGQPAPGTSTAPTPDPQPDPQPTDPQPTGPAAEPATDAKARLDQLADASTLSMDGHWAVQLASKADGITDRTQTTATGSHTFRYEDILAEYESLVAAFPDVPVAIVHGSEISSIPRNKRLYVTIADPGGLASRADVLAWCKDRFPHVSANARLNVCYPRKLQLD